MTNSPNVSPEKTRRQRAEQQGRWAEWAAELLLRLKGYQILARRLKTPVGEVDLVLRKGPLVCFVEVKHRPTKALALASVHPRQCRRIERAAQWWLQQNPTQRSPDVRFDVIAATPSTLPYHVKDAWRPKGDTF